MASYISFGHDTQIGQRTFEPIEATSLLLNIYQPVADELTERFGAAV